jgi:hypothetical protein
MYTKFDITIVNVYKYCTVYFLIIERVMSQAKMAFMAKKCSKNKQWVS